MQDDGYSLLWELPQLRPVAPLVLAAWQDGHLTPAELLAIRQTLERGPWREQAERETLAAWLDPGSPPPPSALGTLQREVRQWLSELPKAERRSLTALSAALANQNLKDAHLQQALPLLASAEEEVQAGELERGAWLDSRTEGRGPASPREVDPARVGALRNALDGHHTETRDFVRELLTDTTFRAPRQLATHEYRERVLEWLRALIDRGLLEHCYPNGLGGGRDVGRFVAAFETLAFFDLSLVVKFGVQAGLFAGAIEALGSERHREIVRQALRGEIVGCFAMTERGHGSNVRGLRTEARYQPDGDCFVITTPDLSAGKEWIGNAADHGRMAVVFAQLWTRGECQGVHAFVVPIRDAEGHPLEGVRIEDCGPKMGLNGVDNGRLWFDSVSVPRDALLDRFGQVAADGGYTSPIPSAGKRFFKMLSTLVGGRIAVAGAANAAAKVGLGIAVRYAVERTQFERADGTEQPLIDYLSHRRRLLPRLAATYAFSFAQHELVEAAEQMGEGLDTELDVDTLAAGLKAVGTWQAIDTLQQCRECCGGQGYLSANRIDALRTDSDVFTTFEGDNTVLLSLVASNLLREYGRALRKRPVRTVVRGWARDVATAVSDRNPVALRDDSSEALRSLEFQASALRFRERSLLRSLTRRIARRMRDGMNTREAFEDCQDHALSLAKAHVEHFGFAAFRRATEAEPGLQALCALFGLWRIEADQAWFLENDFLAPSKSKALRKTIHELLNDLTDGMMDGVEAFGIPAPCLGPLADPAYLRASGLSREP